jgi:hypothetical protein
MTEQKIEAFWRNATAADVARVMKGENVEARFRDSAVRDWKIGHLNGWADGEFRCDLANCWVHCQVYDPQQWYLDKPYPGKGWRLLEKFPDEDPMPGDECLGVSGEWGPSCQAKDGGHQVFGIWYRRRIEPEKVVESKPLLIRRRVIEIGDEIKLPNGRVLVFNGEGFEVKHD